MTLDIPRYRLHNQFLSQTNFTEPGPVVAALGAVQSQDYAGGKWGLGLRMTGATDAALDQAFGLRGDTIELWPAHLDDRAWRISLFGDEIETISEFDPLTGKKGASLDKVRVYANSHYVTPGPTMKQAQRQAYNRVRNVMIPYMYYRDDIGERWAEDSDRLHAWGYLRES